MDALRCPPKSISYICLLKCVGSYFGRTVEADAIVLGMNLVGFKQIVGAYVVLVFFFYNGFSSLQISCRGNA